MHFMIPQAIVWAAAEAPAAAQGQTPSNTPLFFALGAVLVIFYFIMWRPQRREQLSREKLLDSLAKGDKVMTSGGMLGTVESVDKAKGIITVMIAPKVPVEFSRAAIANIVQKKGSKAPGEKTDAAEK